MMRRYDALIRANMRDAERDMQDKPEDRRGFGVVLQLWETYHDKRQIDESQFDKLVLSGFSNGEYRDFIKEQVAAYKSGNPPIIVGY